TNYSTVIAIALGLSGRNYLHLWNYIDTLKYLNKKQSELIYETLKWTVLFDYLDSNNFSKNILHITDSNTKKGISLSQLNYHNKKENNNFLKVFIIY
ncbi:hypothetical protein PFDG_04918, partial [Plasmodium falciparum Dd2]